MQHYNYHQQATEIHTYMQPMQHYNNYHQQTT